MSVPRSTEGLLWLERLERTETYLLILDVTWDSGDELEITCPNVFQTPQIELLGCDAEDDDDCAQVTCAFDSYIECYDEFYFDRVGEQSGANMVTLDTSSPSGDYIRIRFAVFCENVDFDFDETTFDIGSGGKGKGGRRLTRGGKKGSL